MLCLHTHRHSLNEELQSWNRIDDAYIQSCGPEDIGADGHARFVFYDRLPVVEDPTVSVREPFWCCSFCHKTNPLPDSPAFCQCEVPRGARGVPGSAPYTEGEWKCGGCTWRNTGDVEACVMCNGPKGVYPAILMPVELEVAEAVAGHELEPDSTAPIAVEGWNCSGCTFLNHPDLSACEMCGTNAGAAGSCAGGGEGGGR